MEKSKEEQEFHLKRLKDLAERVKAQKETILSQEEIIGNLAYSVKNQVKEGPQENKELSIKLQDMKYKRERLMERMKQLRILMSMNGGKLPDDYMIKVHEEEVSENKEEVERLRTYEDQLLSMIQETTRKLDTVKPNTLTGGGLGRGQYYSSVYGEFGHDGKHHAAFEGDKRELQVDLRQKQAKSFNLQAQLNEQSRHHGQEVAELKFRIQMAQARIDEKATLMY